MEPKNGGLVQMIFLCNWVILRFHVNFQGCVLSLRTLGLAQNELHYLPDSMAQLSELRFLGLKLVLIHVFLLLVKEPGNLLKISLYEHRKYIGNISTSI